MEKVSIPNSQLKRIEGAFMETNIQHLSLPPSVREIDNFCREVYNLESIYVRNELYASTKEGTAILSQDGSELICVIPITTEFEIQTGVRVIKKNVLQSQYNVFFPRSVEVIEENVISCYQSVIEFTPLSKLRSLDFEIWSSDPTGLIINSENFVTMDKRL